MAAIAKTKFARYSSRKVGQVLSLVRNKPVDEAFKILKFVEHSATELVIKTLKSAAANAGKLKQLETIYIKECWVNIGPSLKRIRPRAFGRAAGYKRKMCHLTIIVDDMKK